MRLGRHGFHGVLLKQGLPTTCKGRARLTAQVQVQVRSSSLASPGPGAGCTVLGLRCRQPVHGLREAAQTALTRSADARRRAKALPMVPVAPKITTTLMANSCDVQQRQMLGGK